MKLKEARTKKGMTQKELAAKAGMSQSAIARIECGSRGYSVGSLKRLATALRLSPKTLLIDT